MKVFNKSKETYQKPAGGFLIAHFKRSVEISFNIDCPSPLFFSKVIC